MDSINGLPTHPLFVHAPVVLAPLATLVALALAVRPRWRGEVGIALPLLGVVVLVATQLAIVSGLALEEVLGDRIDASDHEQLALTTRNLLILFFATTVLLTVVDRWRLRNDAPGWLAIAAPVTAASTVVTGSLATWWMIMTGHEGARLVWLGLLP